MSSTVSIQGLITAPSTGTTKIGTTTVTNANNVGEIVNVPMSASSASIAVASSATSCLINPPGNNAATITFKTSANSGDTGLPISPNQASLFSFAATPPTSITFAFGATGASVVQVTIW